jgi:hypothetical protein
MPIDITFITGNGDTTINVINNERVQFYELRLNSEPLNVIFDKDTLLYLKEVYYENSVFTPEYSYSLKQNYPNPFNLVTRIEYSVSENELMNLTLIDILGRKIRTLVNEEKAPGIYGVELDASHLSSGIYFYRLEAGRYSETKKMVLLK